MNSLRVRQIKLDDLVSILIPVYNTKQFLRECVESVCNQNYKNIEIILIDDGSSDGSSELCDDLKLNDERIIVIHQQNMGSGFARNAGLKATKGKYITFVDSDDLISVRFIETLVAGLKNYQSMISVVGLSFVNENFSLSSRDDLINKTEVMTVQELLSGMTNGNMPVSVVNKMYLADIIKSHNICFQEKFRFWEDLDFNIKYLKVISDEVSLKTSNLYFARKRAGSQSRTEEYVINGEVVTSTKYIWQSVNNYEGWNQNIKINTATMYANILISYFYHGGVLKNQFNIEILKNFLMEFKNLPFKLSGKKKVQFFMIKHFPYLAFLITRLAFTN